MTQEELAEGGYTPTAHLRWREIDDSRMGGLDMERPTAVGIGWEGMRNYFVLEQKWVSHHGLRATGAALPDVWVEIAVGGAE